MKTYGQRCPLARALDLVGERWTLLVVRELLLGPRRYTDLAEGLPGVGSNILAARLADLQQAGLVTRREMPPPTAVTVYDLTEAGRALGPSISALSEWGEEHGSPITQSQAVRPAWILTGLARRSEWLLAGRTCELRVGREVFALDGTGGKLSVSAAGAHSPDAIVALELDAFLALATRRISAREARKRGTVQGDPAVGTELLNGISGAVRGADLASR